MGESIKEAVKKFDREHPKSFFGKLTKGMREGAAEKAKERAELRVVEREAYQKAYTRARIARASREGSEAGGKRWYDPLMNVHVGSPAPRRTYVSRPRSHKRKKSKRKRTHHSNSGGGVSFDMFDNWGFMK
jgi:hypothetical protein